MARTHDSDEFGAWEWLRAHRIGLGPFYALLPVITLGVALHLFDTGPTLLALGAFAACVIYWSTRARGWRRPYFAGVGLAVTAWLLWAHLANSTFRSWVWLVTSLAFASVVLAIPWWSDHVRRTHVRMEMVVKNWRVRAERIGLRDTWLSNVTMTDIGWTGKLNWRPGEHEVDKVAGMRSSLEGALGLNVGELRMPPDGKSTNSINLVAILKDPHAAPVMWEIPHTEVDGQLVLKQGSILDEIDLGPQEDGTIKRIRLFQKGRGGRHVLVGGMTDSGKSGLLNLLWAKLALCRNVMQWGIDLKGGVELGPWAKCFDWVVDNRDDAFLMATALNAEMQRRYQLMAERSRNGKPQRVWVPTREDPAIVLSVDEAASILGNASSKELKLFEDIARQGRAAGIILILATQFPTVDAVGTTQIREQLHFGFCFRMKSDRGENFIITDTSASIDAHKIDENRPGTCYCQDGSKVDKMPLRCFYLDDATVAQTADLAAGLGAILVAEVEEFLAHVVAEAVSKKVEDGESFSLPSRWDRDGNETGEAAGSENENETGENENETIPPWNENGDVSLDDITRSRDEALTEIEQAALSRERAAEAVEPDRLGEAAAHEALVVALQSAGPDGVRAKDLMAAATRKSTWLHDKLGELEQEGRATRTKAGGWSWIREDAHAE